MPANVQFKRGLLANLPANKIDGTIYITTDEHAMYLDQGNTRIRIGDFIPVNTIQDLPQSGHAYETAVYYVRDGNILCRWDATAETPHWIQINKAGVVGVTTATGSSGNVVTDITTTTAADGTLRLVVTKSSVATSNDLEDLATRVGNLETWKTDADAALDVIQGDVNTTGSILNAAAAVQSTLLNGETTYTTLKAAADKIRELEASVTSLTSTVEGIEDDISGLDSRVSDAEDILDVLNGPVGTTGSVLQLIDAEATARANADTALDGRVTNLETTVGGLSTDVSANTAAINILNGPVGTTGSVAKTVHDEIAAVVANAPDDFDTLKEISDWISGHADSAAAMNSSITTLTSTVDGLSTTVSGLSTDLDNLEDRVSTAENDIDSLESAVDTLNGPVGTTGSVDYKINQATSSITSDLSDLEQRVSDNEDAIELLNGPVGTTGSVAYAIAQEAAARSSADQTLTTAVNGLDTRLTTAEGSITTLTTTVSNLSDTVDDHTARLTWVDY